MVSKKKYSREQLEEKTVAELRQMCINNGIAGMSKRRKDEVIEALIYYVGVSKPSASIQKTAVPLKKLSTELDSVMTNPNASSGRIETTVRVSCGASTGNFPVVGKSVGAVAEYLREVLNVDHLSTGVVDGDQVKDSYILRSGDVLEFIKSSGRKG